MLRWSLGRLIKGFFFFFAVTVDFIQGGEEKNKLDTTGLFLK